MSSYLDDDANLAQFDVICRAVLAIIAEEKALAPHHVHTISKRLGVSEASLLATLGTAQDLLALSSTENSLASVLLSIPSIIDMDKIVGTETCYHVVIADEVGLILNSKLVCRDKLSSENDCRSIVLGHSLSRALNIGFTQLRVKPWEGWTWHEVIDNHLQYAEHQLDLDYSATH